MTTDGEATAGIADGPASIAGVPALLRYRGSPEQAAQHGTVLLYHGFGGAKERLSDYLAALAEAGFLAVGLDAVGHGERRYPDFGVRFDDTRWDTHFEEVETRFLALLDETAAEVPSVIDGLLARGWARADRIGIGGRSLGGCVCYAAVLADDRIRAAVSIVGSPEWTLPRPHSPHLHPDGFFPAAVLSLAAEFDEHCPPAPIRDFHAGLAARYASQPGRNSYLEYPAVGHFLTPELNADTRRRATAWFARWLAT